MSARARVVLACCVALAACASESAPLPPEVPVQIPAADLEIVKKKRVFFGHRSVGENILDGLRALAGDAVSLGHAPIGQNHDPLGKIKDFEQKVLASDVDIALMKLCYVDFTPETDVDALLTAYRQMIERVRAAKPSLKIVHVTPPLHAEEMTMKSRLKRAMGARVWMDAANVKRAQFGDKLKAAYPSEPVFDLAAVESTLPDGTRATSSVDAGVPVVWPGYTDDGGHLNARGQKVAAAALVHTLALAAR